MKPLLKWWIVFTLQLFAIFAMIYTGFIWVVLANDITFISLGIVLVTFLTSIKIGLDLYQNVKVGKVFNFTPYEFISNRMLTFGLLGTIIGFIYMFAGLDLSSTLSDPNNLTVIKNMIGSLVTGVGTALYTTLFGIIGETFIQTQLSIVENIEGESDNET